MDELAKLDFLLTEMRRWWEAGRVPPELLKPLYAEYSARRAALLVPRPVRASISEYDLSEEKPAPRWSLTTFLEINNIAALHLVGAALLFVGLIALVQWQWASWGRFLLPVLLGGAAAGLMLGGDRLRATEPQSGRVLALLGAAIVPLTVIAFQALRLSEGVLDWKTAWALAGGIGGAVSAWRWTRTKDTLLIPLFFAEAATLCGTIAPHFLVRECGWLALAAGALLAARQQESKETHEAFGGSGLALTLLAIVGSVFYGADTQAGGILLCGAAALGLAAVVLCIGWLGYGACAFALLGATWLAAPGSTDAQAVHLAGMGLLLAVVAAWHRRKGYENASPYRHGAVAGVAIAFPLVAFTHSGSLLWGITLGVTALLWGLLARTEESHDRYSLAAALGVGLLAARYAAVPVDSAFVAATQLAPCPERWLLLAALALGACQGRVAQLLAGVALAWACAFQLPLLDKPEGLAALILAATGTALWSSITRSTSGAGVALVPLVMAAAPLWFGRTGSHWLLPLWTLAIGFAACGFAWRRAPVAAATLWCLGAAHLAGAFLPPALLDLWPLATLPVLYWLSRQESDDSPAWLATVIFALFYTLSAPEPVTLGIVGGALALAALGLGLHREREISVGLGGGIATAATLLALRGTLAYHGFVAALIAVVWQGVAAALRRGAAWRWRSFSTLGLAVSGVSAALALAGVAETDQGRWGVLALAVTAAALSGAAGLRREIGCLHAAFTSALTAFGIFLFDRIGFGPDRLDWFLLPLGIYLLLIAETRRQGALRVPGVLFTLGPSLLAAWLTPAQWTHSVLLAAECLALIALGIGRRTRAYLGGGVLFLVSLLILRLWDPLKEINYGVYLTLLGVGVLGAAIAFERRREALLAWAQSVKARYEGWE